MQIDIHNVNHGQCALVTAPNGARLLVDCGDRLDGDRWWAPSMELASQFVDALALTNLDEDHLRNFHLLSRYVQIGQILSNPTIGAFELSLLKNGGMGAGTLAFHQWLGNPFRTIAPAFPDFGTVTLKWYWNCYLPLMQNNTNDLSLVLFVHYGPFTIAFTGDMEKAGWQQLLRGQPQLAVDLARTNIFVASHHGRESGCSDELFSLFRPEIVVVSDGTKQYETQETDAWYRQRCRGVSVDHNPFRRRYVMTTRTDGSMRITVAPNGSWNLTPVPDHHWVLDPPVPPVEDPFSGMLGLLR